MPATRILSHGGGTQTMIDAPLRPHARYRTADGRVWDTRHYADEGATFTDTSGVLWTRTAVTTAAYGSPAAAKDELDRIEQSGQIDKDISD